MTDMETFAPCRTTPGNCPLATDGGSVRFHSWRSALRFAQGRAAGQRARFRVYFDGSHWRPLNLTTGDET